MTHPEIIANLFFGVLNETDDKTRRILIAEAWTPSAIFIEPRARVNGHAGIDRFALSAQRNRPGHEFRRTGAVDVQENQIRFHWELRAGCAEPIAKGVGVGRLAPDGRLETLTALAFDQAGALRG